jgi:hypothetical protein
MNQSIYCFTSRSRIVHLYGDVTIAGDGQQNLEAYARYSGSLSREGFLSCHISYASVFPVSSEGQPPFNRLLQLASGCRGPILTKIFMGSHSVASYDTQGGVEDLF